MPGNMPGNTVDKTMLRMPAMATILRMATIMT
jgi:hypothetical protein